MPNSLANVRVGWKANTLAPPPCGLSNEVYYIGMSPANHELLVSENELNRTGADDVVQHLHASGFEALKELSRHGYRPSPQPLPNSTGVLVQHKAAPDLVVYPDGTIRVPGTQSLKGDAPAAYPSPRVSWRRGLLFLFVLIAYTALSAIIVINLIAD